MDPRALKVSDELDGTSSDALEQARSMSTSTINQQLQPLKQAVIPKGMSLTRPIGEYLHNSIRICKCTDEIMRLPELADADAVTRIADPAPEASSHAH